MLLKRSSGGEASSQRAEMETVSNTQQQCSPLEWTKLRALCDFCLVAVHQASVRFIMGRVIVNGVSWVWVPGSGPCWCLPSVQSGRRLAEHQLEIEHIARLQTHLERLLALWGVCPRRAGAAASQPGVTWKMDGCSTFHFLTLNSD